MKKFLGLLVAALLLLIPLQGMTAQEISRYDPATEGILSEYYQIENGYITGILPGTSTAKVSNACVPAGVTASGGTVATGTIFTYGEKSLTAVVTGDLNGDGKLTITDMLMLKSALLGETLSQAAAVAGDLNHDGHVSITDFLKAKACLLSLDQLTGVDMGALTLVVPGLADSWTVDVPGVAGYESADTGIVTIDETGRINAVGKTGSAFLYAVDSGGNVLERRMVTVLDEPLKMTANVTEVGLVPGQSQTVKITFNHPVSPSIQWSTTNSGIASVSGGKITAKGVGKATITATLSNGQTAQVSVSVVPPITNLNIERTLYKVKPGHTKEPLLQLQPVSSGEEIIWTTGDPTIATVSSTGVVTGVKYGTTTITATGKYSGLTDSCQVKVCDVKQVALTFDDGPAPRTDDLLDFLKENDLRVTFFLVGNRMSYYTTEVKREAAEGHELGYHSYDHSTQTALSSARITSDFQKSDNLLYELTGKHFTVWRTPGGAYNTRVLNSVPLPHILWSDDTLDWQTRNAYSVYSSIIRMAGDGDIILLHDLHNTTVEGAMRAMKEMNEGDYEFVTVSELLSRNGNEPENGKNYNRAP